MEIFAFYMEDITVLLKTGGSPLMFPLQEKKFPSDNFWLTNQKEVNFYCQKKFLKKVQKVVDTQKTAFLTLFFQFQFQFQSTIQLPFADFFFLPPLFHHFSISDFRLPITDFLNLILICRREKKPENLKA